MGNHHAEEDLERHAEERAKEVCKHCGGLVGIRNPRGDCDHLYWPDTLTDEAKRANGFRKVEVVETKWVK